VPNTQQFFFLPAAAHGVPEHGTIVGVTPELPAGPTSFGIECNHTSGEDILYHEIWASAVLISAPRSWRPEPRSVPRLVGTGPRTGTLG
jgi:hypothetical protein